MKRSPFFLLLLFALLFSLRFGLPSSGHLCAQETKQPNIVYILCDDHRYDFMGNMGHPFLETPHLDAMVENGVQFTHAFVTNSLCSPSRASILTGLYPHNHGVGDNYNPVDETLRFFPQDLQEAGYETAFIGKWHMGDEDSPQRGFDHWVAVPWSGHLLRRWSWNHACRPSNHLRWFQYQRRETRRTRGLHHGRTYGLCSRMA